MTSITDKIELGCTVVFTKSASELYRCEHAIVTQSDKPTTMVMVKNPSLDNSDSFAVSLGDILHVKGTRRPSPI